MMLKLSCYSSKNKSRKEKSSVNLKKKLSRKEGENKFEETGMKTF